MDGINAGRNPGESSESSIESGDQTEGKICSKCGAENKGIAKFCKKCGGSELVENKKCSECGTENPGAANFCRKCGGKF